MVRATGPRGRPVVLKCLLPPCEADDANAFRNEFLLLNALAHPYWVRPRRFLGLPSGGWAIELERASGVPLGEFALRGWWPETCEVARRILSGLEALHHLGVAQLDLKPDQVLVRWDGKSSRGWSDHEAAHETEDRPLEVRLLDLGLAAPFGSPMRGRGTPGFMAPEILRGLPGWDARADLYALGAVLFELFTGAPAFPGESGRGILEAQLRGDIPDPDRAAELPRPVRALLMELLSPDPAERPTGVLDVWQRLREQAPSERIAGLPALLTGSPAFTFGGRLDEVQRFRLRLSASAPGSVEIWRIQGEVGIGKHRLAARLAAIAQTAGWMVTEDQGPPEPQSDVPDHEPRIDVFELSLPAESTRAAPPNEPAGPSGVAQRRLMIQCGQTAAGEDMGAGSGAELRAGARPPDSAAAGTPLSAPATLVHDLMLAPMSRDTLVRMIQTRGVESIALRQALAENALGNPGLLESLAKRLPRELDLAARYAEHEAIEEHFREATVPSFWSQWAQSRLSALAPVTRKLLVLLALADDAFPLERLESLAGVAPGEARRALGAPLDRGLLVDRGSGLGFLSDLWRRAVLEAAGDEAVELGHQYLQDPHNGSSAVSRCELALRLRDESILRRELLGALRELHDSGRYEEEFGLFCRAAGSLHAEPSPLGPSCLGEPDTRRVLSIFLSLGGRFGSLLPDRIEDMVRTAGSYPAARMLLAWMAMGRNDYSRALSWLEFDPSDPTDRFLQGWLRFRVRARTGLLDEASTEIDRLRALDLRSPESADLWLRWGEASVLLSRLRFDEAERVLEGVRDRIETLPPGERASFLQISAVLAMRMGDRARLETDSIRTEELLRTYGFRQTRLISLGLLATLANARGELTTAQTWIEDVLRSWVALGKFEEATTAIVNLSSILLEQGRLGLAWQAVRDGRAFASRAGSEMALLRVDRREAEVLVHIGLAERARDRATRILQESAQRDPIRAAFVRAILGAALFDLGELQPARDGFRRAADDFRASGSPEDAIETLLTWGLRETIAGDGVLAADLAREAIAAVAEMPVALAGLFSLLDGELALAGVSRRDPLAPLRAAVTTLERQHRWYHAWRARWRLAQAEVQAGLLHEALGDYGAARTMLDSVRSSIDSVAVSRRFLGLPPVRMFLLEIDTA